MTKDNIKTYILYWKTGEKETVKGDDIDEAMILAGYSNRAFRDLDYYEEEGAEDCYTGGNYYFEE